MEDDCSLSPGAGLVNGHRRSSLGTVSSCGANDASSTDGADWDIVTLAADATAKPSSSPEALFKGDGVRLSFSAFAAEKPKARSAEEQEEEEESFANADMLRQLMAFNDGNLRDVAYAVLDGVVQESYPRAASRRDRSSRLIRSFRHVELLFFHLFPIAGGDAATQVLVLDELCALVAGDVRNQLVCAQNGFLRDVLGVIWNRGKVRLSIVSLAAEVREKLICLIAALGAFSATEEHLELICVPFSSADESMVSSDAMDCERVMIESIYAVDIIRAVLFKCFYQRRPRAFFCLDGHGFKSSALVLTMMDQRTADHSSKELNYLTVWPKRGLTFSCWLRIAEQHTDARQTNGNTPGSSTESPFEAALISELQGGRHSASFMSSSSFHDPSGLRVSCLLSMKNPHGGPGFEVLLCSKRVYESSERITRDIVIVSYNLSGSASRTTIQNVALDISTGPHDECWRLLTVVHKRGFWQDKIVVFLDQKQIYEGSLSYFIPSGLAAESPNAKAERYFKLSENEQMLCTVGAAFSLEEEEPSFVSESSSANGSTTGGKKSNGRKTLKWAFHGQIARVVLFGQPCTKEQVGRLFQLLTKSDGCWLIRQPFMSSESKEQVKQQEDLKELAQSPGFKESTTLRPSDSTSYRKTQRDWEGIRERQREQHNLERKRQGGAEILIDAELYESILFSWDASYHSERVGLNQKLAYDTGPLLHNGILVSAGDLSCPSFTSIVHTSSLADVIARSNVGAIMHLLLRNLVSDSENTSKSAKPGDAEIPSDAAVISNMERSKAVIAARVVSLLADLLTSEASMGIVNTRAGFRWAYEKLDLFKLLRCALVHSKTHMLTSELVLSVSALVDAVALHWSSKDNVLAKAALRLLFDLKIWSSAPMHVQDVLFQVLFHQVAHRYIIVRSEFGVQYLLNSLRRFYWIDSRGKEGEERRPCMPRLNREDLVVCRLWILRMVDLLMSGPLDHAPYLEKHISEAVAKEANVLRRHGRRTGINGDDVESLIYFLQQEKGSKDIEDVLHYLVSFLSRAHKARNMELHVHLKALGNLLPLWHLLEHPLEVVRVKMIRLIHCYTSYTGQSSSPRPATEIDADHKFNPLDGQFVFEQEHAQRLACSIAGCGSPYTVAVNNALIAFLVDHPFDADGQPAGTPPGQTDIKVIRYPVLLRTVLDLVAKSDTDCGVQLAALQRMSQMLMLPGNAGLHNRHMFTRIVGWQQRLLQLCLPRRRELADSRTRAVNESSLEVFSTALFHRMVGVSGGLMANGIATGGGSEVTQRDPKRSSWIPSALGSTGRASTESGGSSGRKNACIYPKEEREVELSTAFAYLDASLYHEEGLKPSTIARLRKSILIKLLTRALQLLKMAVAGISPADAIVDKTQPQLEQLVLFSSAEVLLSEPPQADSLRNDLCELLLHFWEKYSTTLLTVCSAHKAFRTREITPDQQLRNRRDRRLSEQKQKHLAQRWKAAADLSPPSPTSDIWRVQAISRPPLLTCQQTWSRFTLGVEPVVPDEDQDGALYKASLEPGSQLRDNGGTDLAHPLAPGGVCWQMAQVYLSSILRGVVEAIPGQTNVDVAPRVWALYDLLERNGFVCAVSKHGGMVRQAEVTKREADTGINRAVSCGEAWPVSTLAMGVEEGSPKDGSPLTSGLGSPFESPGIAPADNCSSPIAIPGIHLGKTSSPVMVVNNYKYNGNSSSSAPMAHSESPRSKEASFVMIDEPVEVLTQEDHERLVFLSVFIGIAILERLDYSKATVPQPSSQRVAEAESSKILAMMRRGNDGASLDTSSAATSRQPNGTEDRVLDALCQLFRLVASVLHQHSTEVIASGFFSCDWLPNPKDPHGATIPVETVRGWLDASVVKMLLKEVWEAHARFEEWQAMYRGALGSSVAAKVEQQANVIRQLGERLDRRIRAFEVGGHEDEARRLRAAGWMERNDREDVRAWKEIQRDVAMMPIRSAWSPLRLNRKCCYWVLDRRENGLRMRLSMKRAFKRYNTDCVKADLAGSVTLNQLSALASKSSFSGSSSASDSGSASAAESKPEDASEEEAKGLKGMLQGGGDWDVVELNCAPYAARNEAVQLSLDCQLILPMHVVTGRMDITASHIYFYGDNLSPPGAATSTAPEQVQLDRAMEMSVYQDLGKWEMESQFYETALRSRQWALDDIMEVQLRRYLLRPSALEMFFQNKKAFLFNFKERDQNRKVFHMLIKQKPNFASNRTALRKLYRPTEIIKHRYETKTEQWITGKLSNYEYLMYLNTCSGRTFNDLTQYPVFPWVLSDYTSETIDLNNPDVYRDLSKPVGALNAERLASFRRRQAAYEPHENEPAFLYGSHYSNVGVVLYYLLRVEPFSSFAKKLQGGKFDHADRLFHSVQKTWENCLTSSSDLKELIPEWFSLPEMFTNINSESLGVKQDGTVIGDVVLPPWASSAEEFVRINRLALESDYVSEHLNEWIDLVFGYKQRGTEADMADNLFYHLTYEGAVDLERIDDKVTKQGIEAQIANFGQTPAQLFPSKPHPRRRNRMRQSELFVETGLEFTTALRLDGLLALEFVPSPLGREATEGLAFNKPASNKYNMLALDESGHSELFEVNLLKSYDSEDSSSSLSELPAAISSKVISRNKNYLVHLHKVVVGAETLVILKGKALVTYGHLDCTLKVWCRQSGNLLQVVHLHCGSGRVVALATDECERLLCAGTEDGTLSLWKINQEAVGTIQHLLEELKKSKTAERRSEASQAALLGSVTQVQKTTPKITGELTKPTFMDKILSVLPFQSQRQSLPRVIQTVRGPEHWIVGCHRSKVDCLAISAAFDIVVSYSMSQDTILVYSCSEAKYVRTIALPTNAPATCLHVCESGKIVVATHGAGETWLYAFSINGKKVGTVSLGSDVGIVRAIKSNLQLNGCERIVAFAEQMVAVLDDLLEVVQIVTKGEEISLGTLSSDGRCLMVALATKKQLRSFYLS